MRSGKTPLSSQARSSKGRRLFIGSGMSSLERITRLPLAAIKLGQGFMANLGSTPSNDASEGSVAYSVG